MSEIRGLLEGIDINEAIWAAGAHDLALQETLYKLRDAMTRASEHNLWDFLVSGPMVNEVGVEWDPPTVTISGNNLVAHERMRFI